MKLIVAFLLITASAVYAQNATDIQSEFTQTFSYYLGLAKQFVTKLASVLDERLAEYIATHQKLIESYRSVTSIPGVTLDATGSATLAGLIARIDALNAKYRQVLDKNIFDKELNKYSSMLETQYLGKAQVLIDQLKEYVTRYPAIGKCWNDTKEEMAKIVGDGFGQARNAALTAVQDANSTLNANEVLVNAAISGNNVFLGICRSSPLTVNACVSTFLAVAEITLPAGSGLWELTTNLTVSSNLGLTESRIAAATSSSVLSIEQIIRRIETCVTTAIAQG